MKALLIDDEQLALDYLERQIKETSSLTIVGKFTYFSLVKEKDLLEEVDLIFLDIEMPEMNGLELAEKMLEINSALMIVFVTAFDEYAIQAFELNALDYLLKPVQKDRLIETLNRVEKKANSTLQQVTQQDILQINVNEDLTFQFVEGQQESLHWRTTKAKELFLYLLYRQGGLVPKENLAELLWPDFNQERGYAQLYTAVYHIRKALKNYGDHLTIKNKQENYLLMTRNITIDAQEWEKKIRLISNVHEDNIDEVIEVMTSYEAPFLQAYHFTWAEPERYRIEQLWLQIAYKIAKFYRERDPEESEKWYRKICEIRPEEEEAHYALMQLYDLFGYGVLIDYQYAQLKEELEGLELEISPEVQEWYGQWKLKK